MPGTEIEFEAFEILDNKLLGEQSLFLGTMFSYMTYAYTILTFILCLGALSKRPKSTTRRTFLLYVWSMFLFLTAFMILNTVNKVRAFTTYRNYPGGPEAWIRTRKYAIVCVAKNVCIGCSIWLSDGFLLYRAVMLYTTRQWILILPGLLYITSVVTGGLYIAELLDSQLGMWEGVSFAIPYFICASLCNLSTVFTIAARLLWYRKLVMRVVGPEKNEHGAPYETALTILVESAALHAGFSLVFVVSYAMRSWVARLVIAPLCNARGISSFLIILRLVRRRTITSDTSGVTSDPGVTMTQCVTGQVCTSVVTAQINSRFFQEAHL